MVNTFEALHPFWFAIVDAQQRGSPQIFSAVFVH